MTDIEHWLVKHDAGFCTLVPKAEADALVATYDGVTMDGPWVRAADHHRGAIAAGDALADAVSDIMADDPESVLHTWVRRWREAAHPGGQ